MKNTTDSTKTPKKQKQKKPEKRFPSKKLPALFKKKLTPENFEKKILAKLYIQADKDFIQGMYTEKSQLKGKDVIGVPADATFTKKELKHLKAVSKSIATNKSRFNAAPFIAVVVLIAALGISVTLFKNVAVKAAVQTGLQNALGARCDIQKVNVQIFKANLTIEQLAQANKDSPMTNLFEFQRLNLDFNLAQLLRGRFDAQEIEITGVALGTPRTTSGALPAKLQKKLDKKEKKQKKEDDTGFYSALSGKGGSIEAIGASLLGNFSDYDPQKLVEELRASLQTEKKSKEVAAAVESISKKWADKPAEFEKQANELKASAEDIMALRPESFKNPADIPPAIKKIEGAINNGKQVQASVEKTLDEFNKDKDVVQRLSEELETAVKSDRALLSAQVSKYAGISLDEGKGILTGALDEAGYRLLGKYYPYLQKAVSYAAQMKQNQKAAKEKQKAKKEKASRRAAGRDVYWKEDRIPTILIEHAVASGAGFTAEATDISNDMNKRGEPLKARGTYTVGKQAHSASLTIDARENTSAPLLTADYKGTAYPLSIQIAEGSDAAGVPSFKGTTGIQANLSADEDSAFSVKAAFNMNPIAITATPLPEERINAIYQKALASVKTMNLGADVRFSKAAGLDLNLTTDADKQISAALKSVIGNQAEEAKNEAMARLSKELESKTSGALSEIAGFDTLAKSISENGLSVSAVNDQLEAKKKELTNLADDIQNQAKQAAERAAAEAAAKLQAEADAAKAKAQEEAEAAKARAQAEADAAAARAKAEADAAAERAKKEAEEKAASAAKNAIKGLKF